MAILYSIFYSLMDPAYVLEGFILMGSAALLLSSRTAWSTKD